MNLEQLLTEYETARDYMHRLVADLDEATVTWRPHSNSSAIGWHLGHTAAVNHYMVRNLTAAEPRIDDRLDLLFDSATEELDQESCPRRRPLWLTDAVASSTRRVIAAIIAGRVGAPEQLALIARGMLTSIINHEYQHAKWVDEVRTALGHRSVAEPRSTHLTTIEGYWVLDGIPVRAQSATATRGWSCAGRRWPGRSTRSRRTARRFERGLVQGGTDVGGPGHHLAATAEGFDDLVVTTPGLQVGGDVVAVDRLHRVLLESPDPVVADDGDDRRSWRTIVSKSIPANPNAPSPMNITTCLSGWAMRAAMACPGPLPRHPYGPVSSQPPGSRTSTNWPAYEAKSPPSQTTIASLSSRWSTSPSYDARDDRLAGVVEQLAIRAATDLLGGPQPFDPVLVVDTMIGPMLRDQFERAGEVADNGDLGLGMTGDLLGGIDEVHHLGDAVVAEPQPEVERCAGDDDSISFVLEQSPRAVEREP